MGLLTDTKQRQAVVRVISKHNGKLSVLLFVVGLLWFLALAYRPFNAGTYFSENALLPGLVQSGVPNGFHALHSYTKTLKDEMSKHKNTVPKDWIFKEFQSLGLDTYRHNFTINYPFKMAISETLRGENIYAILRSHRAASFESLVMTAPFRTNVNKRSHTDGSVALMLSLASLFRNNPYWAKNIIFLLTDFEEIGVQAWLEAYHGIKSPYVVADDLPARGGAIQAAVNLELPSASVRYLNLKLEGLNGQLPNLDLVNLAVRLSAREHVPAKLHHRSDPGDQDSWEGFQWSLQTMLHMMWSQASGAPSGNHGLFHRFHIEALTLEGVEAKKAPRSYDLEQIARVVEGIFRSLNNLLERFHQSFFFYLLPSTDSYVSIGLYMPPFGLMVAAAIIKALALWIVTHSDKEDATQPGDDQAMEQITSQENNGKNMDEIAEKDSTDAEQSQKNDGKGDSSPMLRKRFTASSGDSKEKDGEKDDDAKEEEGDNAEEKEAGDGEQSDSLSLDDLDEDDLEHEPATGLLAVIPVIVMAYLLGLLAYSAPYLLTRLTTPVKMQAIDMVFYGILAVFTAGLAFPYLMNRKVTTEEERVGGDWRLLKCVGLIVQGLTLFAVALINISLAFFLAAASLPITMTVRPTKYRVLSLLQYIALLAVSPMGLLYAAGLVNTAMDNPGQPFLLIAYQAIDSSKQMLSLVLVDQYLLHSWTYTLASFAFLPTWLLFWAVPFSVQTV